MEKCEAYIIGGVAGIMTDGGEGRARFGVIISPRGLKGDLAERGLEGRLSWRELLGVPCGREVE